MVSTSLKRIGKSTGDLGPLALSSRSALVNQPWWHVIHLAAKRGQQKTTSLTYRAKKGTTWTWYHRIIFLMLQLLLIVSAPGAKRSIVFQPGTTWRRLTEPLRESAWHHGERLLDQLEKGYWINWIFFSSVVADLALRLGPDSGRSGKKKYKIYETLWLHKRGTSWLSQNKEKKHGNRFSALTPPRATAC